MVSVVAETNPITISLGWASNWKHLAEVEDVWAEETSGHILSELGMTHTNNLLR